MKTTFMAKILLLTLSLFALGGCNTVEGLGRDTAKLGNKIENKGEQKDSAILKGIGKDVSKVGEKMEQKAEEHK